MPSAGIGDLLALMLFHYDFSLIALIGVILLIGIVKKNGIMIVDVAIRHPTQDKPARWRRSSRRACCAFVAS